MSSPVIRDILARGLFDRLPATFATYTFDRIRDWHLLFPAEQSYFERLLGLLDRSDRALVDELFAPLAEIEQKMGVDRKQWNVSHFHLGHVDFLQRSPHYSDWRRRVGDIFGRIDPLLEEEVARQGRPRLVVVSAPSEVPASPDRMWKRIDRHGRRVALAIPADLAIKDYLSTLAGDLLNADYRARYAAWLIEAGADLAPRLIRTPAPVVLSYGALEEYKNAAMAAVRRMVETKQLRGPQQLGTELKKLPLAAPPGRFGQDPLLADFLRSVLLAGNGTLLINNTFAEWAAVQAARRARPVVTVVAFGIRNKVKPFSSLLIYSDQEKANPIPTQMDTLGTHVDLEVFYQYVWQEFEKYAEYRRNTVYLFVGEGMEEMLVIAPPDFRLATDQPVTLARVNSTAKEWLGV